MIAAGPENRSRNESECGPVDTPPGDLETEISHAKWRTQELLLGRPNTIVEPRLVLATDSLLSSHTSTGGLRELLLGRSNLTAESRLILGTDSLVSYHTASGGLRNSSSSAQIPQLNPG